MADTLYETLGVPKTASADTIRKTYRKLARRHHPDVNPGDTKAEDTFKRISAAYEVLSDEKKRAAYDEFGDASLAGGFDPDKARAYTQWQDTRQRRESHFDEGPAEFDFSELFGRARGPGRGSDLRDGANRSSSGHRRSRDFARDPRSGHRPRANPTRRGQRLHRPHRRQRRAGSPRRAARRSRDRNRGRVLTRGCAATVSISTQLPVTLDEAYNGASVEVPTFDGPVMLNIPARYRRAGPSYACAARGSRVRTTRGDLFAVLDVRMPDRVDDALATALHASRRMRTRTRPPGAQAMTTRLHVSEADRARWR